LNKYPGAFFELNIKIVETYDSINEAVNIVGSSEICLWLIFAGKGTNKEFVICDDIWKKNVTSSVQLLFIYK